MGSCCCFVLTASPPLSQQKNASCCVQAVPGVPVSGEDMMDTGNTCVLPSEGSEGRDAPDVLAAQDGVDGGGVYQVCPVCTPRRTSLFILYLVAISKRLIFLSSLWRVTIGNSMGNNA